MFINEISADKLSDCEKILRPGESSMRGFINESESLMDVYNEDNKTLNDKGITYDQIADILEALIVEFKVFSKKGRGAPYMNDDFVVTNIQYKGYQNCPFSKFCDDSCEKASTDYRVFKNSTNQSIVFSELIVHLIRDHHFFEGHVQYRLDPSFIIDFLNIKPDVDYKIKKTDISSWKFKTATCTISDEVKQFVNFHHTDKKCINDDITLYHLKLDVDTRKEYVKNKENSSDWDTILYHAIAAKNGESLIVLSSDKNIGVLKSDDLYGAYIDDSILDGTILFEKQSTTKIDSIFDVKGLNVVQCVRIGDKYIECDNDF